MNLLGSPFTKLKRYERKSAPLTIAGDDAWHDITTDFSLSRLITADAMIRTSTAANNNYGGSSFLNISGTQRILLRANLDGINLNALTSAKLVVKLRDGASVADGSATIYAITSENGDWVEGTKGGSTEEGSNCWNYKAYSASSPVSWAGSAGLFTSGVDYVAAAIATFNFTKAGASGEPELEIPLNLTNLKAALESEGSAGYIIALSSGEFHIHAKEGTGSANRFEFEGGISDIEFINMWTDTGEALFGGNGLPNKSIGITENRQLFNINGLGKVSVYVPAGTNFYYEFEGQQ